jgi:small-conductance mechanosensitive channel
VGSTRRYGEDTYRLKEISTRIQSRVLVHESSYLLKNSGSLIYWLYSQQVPSSSINQKDIHTFNGMNQLSILDLITVGILMACGLTISMYLKIKSGAPLKNGARPLSLKYIINSDLPIIISLLFISVYINHVVYAHVTLTLLLVNGLSLYLFSLFLIKTCLLYSMKGYEFKKVSYIFYLIVFLTITFYVWALNYQYTHDSGRILNLLDLRYSLLFCVLGGGILDLLKNGRKWLNDQFITLFIKHTSIMASYILIGFIGYYFLEEQLVSPAMAALCKVIIIAVLNLELIRLIETLFQLDYVMRQIPRFIIFRIKISLRILGFIAIIASCFGYLNFGLFFIINLLFTLGTFTFFWRASLFLKTIYTILCNPKYKVSQKFRAFLGVKSHTKLLEILIIRMIMNLALIISFLCGLLEIWGLTTYKITDLYDSFHEGIHLFGLVIYLPQTIRAANIFCVLILLGRVLKAYFVRNHIKQDDKHSIAMVSSLINYAVFIIAIIVALYITGINLKGVMVLTGALFVGIGFGLNRLISDFISGFLLMIHKPIKIGDHIIIDNTEGFVKKIRAVSTELITLSHFHVFIPNTVLIQQPLTNLTLNNNQLCRIKIQLSLQDNFKIEEARQLLLEVGKNSPNVIQDPPNQPSVLFQLSNIELWCIVDDINRLSLTVSDISFAIIHAFNEKKIDIKINSSSLY